VLVWHIRIRSVSHRRMGLALLPCGAAAEDCIAFCSAFSQAVDGLVVTVIVLSHKLCNIYWYTCEIYCYCDTGKMPRGMGALRLLQPTCVFTGNFCTAYYSTSHTVQDCVQLQSM
jgi:hypothetical protein